MSEEQYSFHRTFVVIRAINVCVSECSGKSEKLKRAFEANNGGKGINSLFVPFHGE